MTTTTGSTMAYGTGPGRSFAAGWWAILLRGMCGVLFGIATFVLPFATLGALTLLFGVYLLADGVFAIIAGMRAATHRQHWALLLLEGIVNLIAAGFALALPGLTLLLLINLLGAWGIVSGVVALFSAFRLRIAHGRVWLGLAGVLSVVWGLLLFAFPIGGALVLAWWLGAYALMFGISLIILAVRLRRHHSVA